MKKYYHFLVWPHPNPMYSFPEVEPDITLEDCVDIMRGIIENKTFLFNSRKRFSDDVRKYEVYMTELKLTDIRVKDTAFIPSSDGDIIASCGEKVTREIRRKIEKNSYSSPNKMVKAFISASFSDEADRLVSWFIQMIESLGIETVWLKEKFQARPTEEKIKENIRLCNCFVQIITREVVEQGKEMGWLGNEIAWARESEIDNNIAVFVERGFHATGLASTVADNLPFSRDQLYTESPKIAQYLNDLKERVLQS